jgi:hypothetical protein
VTQRYIHIDEALRLAADKIASEIADLLEGRAPRSRVRERPSAPSDAHREALPPRS